MLRNTLIWTIVVPLASTAFGLAIAYLTDRMKYAGIVKSLIFLPMAISFVGASIIWKFVYTYEPNPNKEDIGLLSALVKAFGARRRTGCSRPRSTPSCSSPSWCGSRPDSRWSCSRPP